MIVLGVDTSQLKAVTALMRVDESGRVDLVASEEGSISVSHSEALLPLIDRLLQKSKKTLFDVDAFAVGTGPGSFTGLRIGLATVKALAQAQQKKVAVFSSLRALALSADPTASVVMENAYQGQVFVGWSSLDGHWHEDALAAVAWVDSHAEPLHSKVLGSGAVVYSKQITDTALEKKLSLDCLDQTITASGLGRVLAECIHLFGSGQVFVSYLHVQANYMRPSQAEITAISRGY